MPSLHREVQGWFSLTIFICKVLLLLESYLPNLLYLNPIHHTPLSSGCRIDLLTDPCIHRVLSNSPAFANALPCNHPSSITLLLVHWQKSFISQDSAQASFNTIFLPPSLPPTSRMSQMSLSILIRFCL